MGDKIEPCPWCGSSAAVGKPAEMYVLCTRRACSVRGPVRGDITSAIAAWNEVAGLRGLLVSVQATAARVTWIGDEARRLRADIDGAMATAARAVDDREALKLQVTIQTACRAEAERETASLRAEVERLKAEAEERNDRDWSRST